VRARVRVPVGAVLPRTQESDTEGRRHRGVVNKKNNKKNNLVINGLTAVSRFSWIYLCFGGGVVVVVFWFCVCVCVCVRGACFGLGFSARENANVPKRWQHQSPTDRHPTRTHDVGGVVLLMAGFLLGYCL
jgi:hypothetical protein